MEDFRIEADFPTIGHRALLVNARRIKPAGSMRDPLILVAMNDVTDVQQCGGNDA